MSTPRTTAEGARLDPLALASLLGALVLGWCPLGGIAAIVVGAIAIRRISATPASRTGTGLAAAGIGLATAILVVEAWLLGSLQSEVQDSMEAQAVSAVEGALTPLPAEAPEWDPRTRAPGDAEQAAFSREVSARLGAVRLVAVTGRTVSGLADPTVSVTFNADCERGTAFGQATFATERGTLPPRMLLQALEIEVAGRRMRLPAEETKP